MARQALLHAGLVRRDPVPQLLLLTLADMSAIKFDFELIDAFLSILTVLLKVGSLATSLLTTLFLASVHGQGLRKAGKLLTQGKALHGLLLCQFVIV